jgi:hypothetical protein
MQKAQQLCCHPNGALDLTTTYHPTICNKSGYENLKQATNQQQGAGR